VKPRETDNGSALAGGCAWTKWEASIEVAK